MRTKAVHRCLDHSALAAARLACDGENILPLEVSHASTGLGARISTDVK